MIKLVDSCSSSQAHYQFNDKLSEELLFDRQSNFFQVRSRRLNDFPLIHLFSCHTSSTTNCSLILTYPALYSSFTDLGVLWHWPKCDYQDHPGRQENLVGQNQLGQFCVSLCRSSKTFSSDWRQHGALHRVFGHQRNRDYLLDMV